MKNSILIIEDDTKINKLIYDILEKDYVVYQAYTAKEGMSLITANSVSVIILDLGLPDLDGMDVIEKVRKYTTTPILVVSARTNESDIVKALDSGADDYLVKPFRNNELKSRIKTAIRHSLANDILTTEMTFNYSNFSINFNSKIVQINGEQIQLTLNEYKIIELLCKNAGKVLTYDFIQRSIWGPHSENANSALRVHMANIRRKIENNPVDPKFIITHVGIGYRFNID